MSKWKVTGCRKQRVFCYVEADNEDEALEKAEEQSGDNVTTWQVDEEAEKMNEQPPVIWDAEEV